jgi:hypothetical protein
MANEEIMVDIFEFWSKIGRGEKIHPADRSAFARMDAKRHGFRLDCLSAAFGGRLRDAPVVLLYLSPGFSQADLAAAKTNEGKDFYVRRSYEPAATSWTRSRTKNFGDWENSAAESGRSEHWCLPLYKREVLRIIARVTFKPRLDGMGTRCSVPGSGGGKENCHLHEIGTLLGP